ncbi:9919_t:CDS:2, partial [Gigaspora margarita]
MWNSSTSAVQVNASTSTNDPKTDTSNDTGTESLTWISWFCGLPGHEYFAEVAEDFIEDDFNLTGLNSMVPFYKEALEMILDVESGKHSQVDKYESKHFGICPRYYCQSCPVIPCGRSDMPGLETVKLFCPSCLDLYTPPSSRFHNVDGAFFGTTFPHLLFQQYPDLLQNTPTEIYEPRIFGFKVSEKSRSGPRMQWLRLRPSVVEREVESHVQSEGGGEGNDDGEDDESVLGPGGGENN